MFPVSPLARDAHANEINMNPLWKEEADMSGTAQKEPKPVASVTFVVEFDHVPETATIQRMTTDMNKDGSVKSANLVIHRRTKVDLLIPPA